MINAYRFYHIVFLLNNIGLKNVVFGIDKVSGDIELDTHKFLVCTIPYLDDWNVYVDGKKVKKCIANIKYIGVDLPPGYHKVEFVYDNLYIKIGELVFVFAIFILILLILNIGQRDKKS